MLSIYHSVTVYAGNPLKLKMMDDVMMDGDIVACPDAVKWSKLTWKHD